MAQKIGEFLMKLGAMNQEQVEFVLRRQKEGDKRLFGQIALELGYLSDDGIKRFVDYLDKNKEE